MNCLLLLPICFELTMVYFSSILNIFYTIGNFSLLAMIYVVYVLFQFITRPNLLMVFYLFVVIVAILVWIWVYMCVSVFAHVCAVEFVSLIFDCNQIESLIRKKKTTLSYIQIKEYFAHIFFWHFYHFIYSIPISDSFGINSCEIQIKFYFCLIAIHLVSQ